MCKNGCATPSIVRSRYFGPSCCCFHCFVPILLHNIKIPPQSESRSAHNTEHKKHQRSAFTSINLNYASHKRLSIIMKLTIAIFLAGLAECSSSSSSPWPHRRMMHRSLQASTACEADTDDLFANNLDLDTARNALAADTTATLDACNIDLTYRDLPPTMRPSCSARF